MQIPWTDGDETEAGDDVLHEVLGDVLRDLSWLPCYQMEARNVKEEALQEI